MADYKNLDTTSKGSECNLYESYINKLELITNYIEESNPYNVVLSWSGTAASLWRFMKTSSDIPHQFLPPIVVDYSTDYPAASNKITDTIYYPTLAQYNMLVKTRDNYNIPIKYECRIYNKSIMDGIKSTWNCHLPTLCASVYMIHLLAHEFTHYVDAPDELTRAKPTEHDVIMAIEKKTERTAISITFDYLLYAIFDDDVYNFYKDIGIIPRGKYDIFLRNRHPDWKLAMSMVDYFTYQYQLMFEDQTKEEYDAIERKMNKLVKWQQKMSIKYGYTFTMVD